MWVEFTLQTTETGKHVFESCLAQEEVIPLSDHPNNDASQDKIQLALLDIVQLQQRQLLQHQQHLDAPSTSSIATDRKPRFELTKPGLLDGQSCSPEGWIEFHEYASEKNYWTTDEDRIKNHRLFLTGMATKWYELRMFSHANDT